MSLVVSFFEGIRADPLLDHHQLILRGVQGVQLAAVVLAAETAEDFLERGDHGVSVLGDRMRAMMLNGDSFGYWTGDR